MSSLERLGSSLTDAIRKIIKAPIVDESVVNELVKDFQRALLQADVKVQLVLEISEKIRKRTLNEQLPRGISRREHLIKVIYEELTTFLGDIPAQIRINPGVSNILMLVGVQGSGKTTSAAKIARYFQKRGFKTALICADTFRFGAFHQLQQLADKTNVPMYGDLNEKNSFKIAKKGIEKFRSEGYEIIILDTAGRHKNEESLIKDMKELAHIVNPDEIILIIDATIGQQASIQAEAFHEATKIGSVFLTKLDGSARGGGALSAVASIKTPIKFIGMGEGIDAIDTFVPSRFVGRLLGMGDIEGLIHKVKEAEAKIPRNKAKAILKGKFTLDDMYEQMESMKSMGPLKHILKMIPNMGYRLPENALDEAEDRLKKWHYIIQSMTKEERDDPKILSSSRIKRVARGSGTSEKEVKKLIKQYFTMRKFMRSIGKRKMPPFLKKMLRTQKDISFT
ncbi:MAG: signal recognition particle protein [Candidatus Bathyarchaeota archaeon]|nr:MAG: signal recognition particle protein [Candidatus Bathyarchaeota archaeon]